MEYKRKTTLIRINKTTHKKLIEVAKKDRRTLITTIDIIVDNYIKKHQ